MNNEVKEVAEDLKQINGGKPLNTRHLADYLGYKTTDAIRMAVMRGKLRSRKMLGRHRFDPEETARCLVGE